MAPLANYMDFSTYSQRQGKGQEGGAGGEAGSSTQLQGVESILI